MHAPTTELKSYLRDKVIRVRIENIWFIVYEFWKLWLVIDGILQFNSLTIIAAAAFTCFSGVLGVMQIIESVKWDNSLDVNLYLQIAMTTVVWIITIPTAFVAVMLFKAYGWNLIEKIGNDRRLQNMYYTVQCFTLMIKIDIFFEVLLLVFYAVCANINTALWAAATVLAILCVFALFIGRMAISEERHWMMSLFSLFQGAIIFVNLAVMVMITDPADVWYTLSIYACASVVIVVFTLYMAVQCQRNFSRGLRPYVKWSPFQFRARSSVEPPPRQPPVPPPHRNMQRQSLLADEEEPVSSTSTQPPTSMDFTEYYRMHYHHR
ncbi:hypothetical protein BJV82DRAFT_599208 [Fennellomyces sp. T-0311]|nr:hypothetical protein BJV82DRAFT_599208 [Fennellomyces sp. T-0311]